MDTYVFYYVNAALYFRMEGINILIDGLHEGETGGFSPMPFSLEKDLDKGEGIFTDLDAALFTHMHPDHFSHSRLDRLLWLKPGLDVFVPDDAASDAPGLSNVPVSGTKDGILFFDIGPVRVYAIRNLHDGEMYHNDPHCSLFLSSEKGSFFIAGDALLTHKEAHAVKELVAAGPLRAAFVNLYQAASEEGRRFIECISPERTFLYHLPFPEDDIGGFRNLARQLCERDGNSYLEIPQLMSRVV